MTIDITHTADRGAIIHCSTDTADLASAACRLQRQAQAHYGNTDHAEHLNYLATLWQVATHVQTAYFGASDLRTTATALAAQRQPLAHDGHETERVPDLRETLSEAAERLATRGQTKEMESMSREQGPRQGPRTVDTRQ